MAGASSVFTQKYENLSNPLPGAPTEGVAYSFVADNATAAFTAHTTALSFDGALAAVGVKFGATPPNSLTITITDVLGIAVATGTLTASGYLSLDRQLFFTPGPVTITLTGNTTNSAAVTIVMVFA